MLKRTRMIVFLLIFALLVSACSAPVDAASTPTPAATAVEPTAAPTMEPAAPTSVTVTDAGGVAVTLPADVKKIVVCCYGGVTHELAALGVQGKIIAQPDMAKFPTLAKMYPEFAGLPFVGSFNDVNVEEILALEPDVVINSVTSNEGNDALRNAGVTVLQALTGKGSVEKLKNEFLTMGEAFGNKAQAEKLVAYWNEKIEMIQSRVAKIENKKSVYYMLGAPTHTNGKGWWGDDFVTMAGGMNVAADLTESRDTTLEQVIAWNPDVIILSENEGKFMPTNDILNDGQLKNIKAIQDKAVYQIPIGMFWWDRPSPESVLGFLWLAQTLYPEQFADLDLKKETADFYKTFFNYTLTDAEYDAFINPVR